MVSLQDYEAYWEGIARRVPGIRQTAYVTVDQDMSKRISALGRDESPVMFVVVPSANTEGRMVDALYERHVGIIFIMAKYDAQRGGSYACLKETQPLMEQVKDLLLADSAMGCPVLGELDLNSLSTLPESDSFGMMSGWSLGFSFLR